MSTKLQFFPDAASTVAGEVDFFYILMVLLCGAVAVGIAVFLVYQVLRYHRRSENELPPADQELHSGRGSLDRYPFLPVYGNVCLGRQALLRY